MNTYIGGFPYFLMRCGEIMMMLVVHFIYSTHNVCNQVSLI